MGPAAPAEGAARRVSPRRLLVLGAALGLGGCASPSPPPPPPARIEPLPVAAPAEPVAVAAEAKPRRLRLRPMKVRPLEVKTECSFKDELGYAASTRLDISYAEVHAFAATVDVPHHGSCRFDLADFHQVRRTPHVELADGKGCTVRVWDQGPEVTVAFSGCAARCTSGTFDYVWPILVDRRSGRCK